MMNFDWLKICLQPIDLDLEQGSQTQITLWAT